MHRSILLLLGLAGGLGCASGSADVPSSLETGPEPPPMVEASSNRLAFRLSSDRGVAVATIEGSRAEVFPALVQAYDTIGIEIGGIDATRSMLQSERIRVSRSYAGERLSELFHCGRTLTGDRADTWRLDIEITSQVQSEGTSRSRLATRVSATARTMDGTSTNPVPCTTSGKLEEKIALVTTLMLVRGK